MHWARQGAAAHATGGAPDMAFDLESIQNVRNPSPAALTLLCPARVSVAQPLFPLCTGDPLLCSAMPPTSGEAVKGKNFYVYLLIYLLLLLSLLYR